MVVKIDFFKYYLKTIRVMQCRCYNCVLPKNCKSHAVQVLHLYI
jgi:hypothetical protein